MKKLVPILIMLAATLIWYGFKSVKAKTVSETSSGMPATNLTGADLTGANLAGVSLDGVSSAIPPCLMERSIIQVVKINVYNYEMA